MKRLCILREFTPDIALRPARSRRENRGGSATHLADSFLGGPTLVSPVQEFFGRFLLHDNLLATPLLRHQSQDSHYIRIGLTCMMSLCGINFELSLGFSSQQIPPIYVG